MTGPIRVLQLIASSRGGGAGHVRDLALRLNPGRFRVQVAMPEDGGHVSRHDFEAAGIPFHRLKIARGLSLAALGEVRHLARQVDVLHLHGARAALYGRLAVASLGGTSRPCVVHTVHGFAAPHYPEPRRSLLLAIEHELARFTDRFVAVCRAEADALQAVGVAPPERLSVVRNGIDVARFRDLVVDRAAQRGALGVPGAGLLVTTVCRLYKPRDFETLLRAFQGVVGTQPDAHLLIVGDGPYRPRVEARVAELGLASSVTLAGMRQDVPAILAASDLFVLATHLWEGLPLTVLEAMAARLPVVASDVGGIGEAVAADTGTLVPPNDPVALQRALLTLFHDAPLARAIGHRGLERVEQQFGVERMVREIEAVYEHCTSR